MDSPRSKVEIKGFEAKYYDLLMGLFTLGQYNRWIRKAVRATGVADGWNVAELGSGTGIAACEFSRLIGKGQYIGLEIGKEMLEKATKRCRKRDNVKFIKQRIEQPFVLPFQADIFFMSFVMHGLENHDKEKVLENVRNNLKDEGLFGVLDYSQMRYSHASWFAKLIIWRLECPLAGEFAEMGFPRFVKTRGFEVVKIKKYFMGIFSFYLFRKI